MTNITFRFFLISLLFSFSFSSSLENCVHYDVSVSHTDVVPGESIILEFDIKIDKGFHIYSTDFDKSLSPTYVEFEDSTIISSFGKFKEPNPKKKYDPNFDMDVYYHMGEIKLSLPFTTSTDVPYGERDFNFMLYYLACEQSMCIPNYDDHTIKINFIDEDIRPEYVIEIDNGDNIKSGVSEFEDEKSKGLFSFILFSFGMGLLALLTPCVFPMIPITVAFFTKEGEKDSKNPFTAALVYTLGIITIFTSLGLLLAITLGASGANQVASNPWINLFIGFLFIYFALSLFGLYEIEVPSVIRQFSLSQEGKGGYLGILFMSLTFTLTSFTCTVGFVGFLLVSASQGEYYWPLVGMIFFSLAFALPFFFLALFPQYLSKLPSSGGWLNSVKVIMGFLELGAAMKFISNADLIWTWGIFDKFLVLLSWAVISILAGIYLLGWIKFSHDSKLSSIGVPRKVLSILFLSFGLYLGSGLYGYQIHGLIVSYLPPDISNSSELMDKGWYVDNMEAALLESKKQNKPVFVDFTGYTCTNCRWMEDNIFVQDNVKELFKDFILLKLFCDGKKGREYSSMEKARFGTVALPFYVVLNSDDEAIMTFHGYDTDVTKFEKFLTESLEKYHD